MTIMLSSCGASELVGKWQTAELFSADANVTADFTEATGLPVGSAYQIEFRKNGTGTIRYYYDLTAEEFTWETKKGKVFINDYDVFEYSIEDGRLVTDYVYQIRFGGAKGVYGKYCNYSFSGQTEVDSVGFEKVGSFEVSDSSREIALTRLAGFACAAADSEINALIAKGDRAQIPTSGTHSFSANGDADGSQIWASIQQLLHAHGLDGAQIELTIENDRCIRAKLMDSAGYSGVYDAAEASLNKPLTD